MKRFMLPLFFIVFIGVIFSCGGELGKDSNSKEENTNSEKIDKDDEVVNVYPQPGETVNSPTPILQVTSHKKVVVVKVDEKLSSLMQSQTLDMKVYYKKEGDFKYTLCTSDTEYLYLCELTYYNYELPNTDVIFTYDMKLFNVKSLEEIHREEIPEVVISVESTNELKDKGIIKNVNNVLLVEFLKEENIIQDVPPKTFFLNISNCTYK